MLFQKEIQTLQFLPVKGIINARDLGGYVTADGRTVRSGKLIRKFNVKKLIMIAAFNKKAQQVARDMYPNMITLKPCQRKFSAFLRRLIDAPQDGAVLFHCTQGKDRTGLASAYILAALGVDRETIIADFDATNAVYERDVRRLSRRVRFWGGKEEQVSVVKAFIGANTDNFVKALDLLDAQFGSMDAYLRDPLGLTDADIEILRTRYLM